MGQQSSNGIEGAIKFLLEMVNDSDAEFAVERRIQAALITANLGGAAVAVAALVELDESLTLGSYTTDEGAHHLKIAREVANLGCEEAAVGILAAICENDDFGTEDREEAAQEILRMGDTVAGASGINAVFYYAHESGNDVGFDEAEYRITAAERMHKAGNTAGAVDVLTVITERVVWSAHDRFSRVDRWNAAATLSNLGANVEAAKAFLSLAVDDNVSAGDQERLDAALKVVELGDWEMATEALLSVAAECEEEEIRLKAAINVASCMDKGTEHAIEIIGSLLSQRYSSHQLIEAQIERDFAVSDGMPRSPDTAQEKAWALILQATKVLYPGAFAD